MQDAPIVLSFVSAVSFIHYEKMLQTLFPTWLMNSFIVALSVTTVNILVAAAAGYSLAYRFPGSKSIMNFTLLALALPYFMTIVPIYIMFAGLKLLDTYLALILPWVGHPFAIFLMRQFFVGVPKDMREAAILDGCSEWQVLTRIYMPIAKAAVVMVAVTEFVTSWNEFLIPLLMVTTGPMKTVILGIGEWTSRGAGGASYGMIFAACVVATIPAMVLFAMFSKSFLEGTKLVLKG